MPWLGTITVVGLVVLAALIWLFLRTRSSDLIEEMMTKRRASCQIVTRGDYVEGINHIPVALALTSDTIYYENPDIQASLELARIDEVEYDDELSTGKDVAHGRAHRAQAFGRGAPARYYGFGKGRHSYDGCQGEDLLLESGSRIDSRLSKRRSDGEKLA